MTDWKVLLTDGLNERGQSILRAEAQVNDRDGISADELLQVIGNYDALIVRGRTKVTPQVIESAGRLKVIGRAGVGVDNINLPAAKAKGIAVVNAPKSTSKAVAELTIGLMFALARAIPKADSTMKAGEWIKKQLEGIELAGKTLGIIGMGNIGCAVAQRAAAMDMTVLGCDTRRPVEEIEEYCAEVASMPEILARADFITLHVPLNDETRGMIGSAELAAMKRGVFLVCTARGNVIDEGALFQALEAGQVAGAALDVFATEPPGLNSLVAHPRVIATPHIGAQTEEAQVRAAEDIASEVLLGLHGKPLRWRVA